MSMKNNNYRKGLVKLSFSLLVLATASSLAVSVFAFSSAASLLQVDDIKVQLLTPASIKMGLKNTTTGDIDYYDSLTDDNLVSSGYSSFTGRSFYPVSSSFSSKWLVKGEDGTYDSATPKFTKEYESNGKVEFPGYDTSSNHFISQEIYLHEEDTNSLPVNIYLKDLTLTAATKANEQKAKDLKYAVTSQELDKIADCMRVSILTPDAYYIIDPNKNGTTVLAGKLNATDGDDYYDTYGIEYGSDYLTSEALFGEYEGDKSSFVYSSPLTSDSSLADTSKEASVFNAKSEAGVKKLDLSKTIDNGVKLKDEVSYEVKDLAYSESSSSNTVLVSLSRGETKRIVISYYVEGWDLDCLDSVQYASFTSSLSLNGTYDYTGLK